MKTPRHHMGASDGETIAVPISVRLPAPAAFKLYLIAEQMMTSVGKLLASLLEDAFPAFEDKGVTTTKLRIPQVYHAMKAADLLRAVNERDLEERILKRNDPGGPTGRPPKSRSVK